jgi:hypothetical protein
MSQDKWIRGKGVRSLVWTNKALKRQINISTDSSKQWFVSLWDTNRLGNSVRNENAQFSGPISTKKDAIEYAKKVMLNIRRYS